MNEAAQTLAARGPGLRRIPFSRPGPAWRATRGLAGGFVALILAAGAPPASAHPSALERIDRLDAVIRSSPGDPRGYVQRAQAYAEEGHFEEALADLRRAETLGDPVGIAFDLGRLHHQMGRLAEARADLDRWLARNPAHAPGLLLRAQIGRDLGDRAAALADYRRYFEVQAKPNPGDYLAAAKMLAAGGTDGASDALAILDAGLQRLGPLPALQREAIALERRRGNLAAALRRLDTLEPSLGASPDWRVDRGELLLQAGRRDEARVELEAASAQLASLRPTEARRALSARLERLLAEARRGEAVAPATSSEAK